jgi:imidazolonepropionase-like amidohydrolase
VTPPLRLTGTVLPGGERRTLWVRDGRITADPVPDAQPVSDSGWIVPGLVDAHCHVGLGPDGPIDDHDGQVAQAVTDRDVGALLLRDCGSPVDTRWLQEREDTPRLIRAGRHLARPRRYLRGLAVEVEPADLPAEVDQQVKDGDGWVKLVGDWIDRDSGDLAPLWTADTLVEAVRRAHAGGARVAVHTFGEEALPDLIAAGVDSIEHGSGLTDDLIPAMAERGAALVPTLINVANFPAIADSASKFPSYAARMRRLHRSARDRVRSAYDAGIPIYAGSDAGGLPHGLIVDEILALHEAGLSTVDALAAASWRARSWLGLDGIEEGAPADLVVYDADPRADLQVLRAPSRIVLRGRVVR